MKDEITEFFGNIENITDFSITKWIYHQTNNLDANIFCKLSLDYKNYCRSRVFHEQMLLEKTDKHFKKLNEFIKNDPDFFSMLLVKYYVIENGKIQQKIDAIKPNPRFNFNCKYLYYEFENFQNIMHELFKIIKSKDTTITDKEDYLLKNPNQTIFKNDFAFTLFDKMKGYYNDTSKEQANYSFLFDIMKKDGFVICKGKKFIDFLSEFNISMTKIDSSKTGNKDKAMLYDAIKGNLEQKHKKSTV